MSNDENNGASPPAMAAPTHAAVMDFIVRKKLDAGSSPKRVGNFKSAYNRFLSTNGLTPEHLIGLEFGPNFEGCLDIAVAGLVGSSRNNARSLMRGNRREYLEFLKLTGLPAEFGPTLMTLVHANEGRVRDLAKRLGCAAGTIWGWGYRGIIPHASQLPIVQKLEEELQVPPGTLVNLLPHMRFRPPVVRMETRFAKKLAVLMEKEYRLVRADWDPKFQGQFGGLKKFKTDVFVDPGMSRRKRWRIRKGGECPTAERVGTFFERVFGYMLLPADAEDPLLRGAGLSKDQLSLVWPCVPKNCRQFLGFAARRAAVQMGDKDELYTSEAIWVISLVISLLQVDTGYFAQKVEFASEPGIAELLPPGENLEERWKKWCGESVIELRRMMRGLRPFITMGRDPTEAIPDILEREHPISALIEMAANMEATIPPSTYPKARIATAWRDLFQVRLMTAAPLRIKMSSIMTYRPNNTGHLRQRPDGSWWLHFDSNEFKNEEGAAKGDYDVRLPKNIYPTLEEYLFKWRLLLAGAAHNDCVFVRGEKGPKTLLETPMVCAALSDRIFHASRKYLPGCLGFHSHAIRHIVATDLVRNDPVGGIARAAAALHDTEPTVLAKYGHLRIQDRFASWIESYDDIHKAMKADGKGK